jgi:hypothetical protein
MLDARFRIPDAGSWYRFALSFYIRTKILASSLNLETIVYLKRYEISKIALIIYILGGKVVNLLIRRISRQCNLFVQQSVIS